MSWLKKIWFWVVAIFIMAPPVPFIVLWVLYYALEDGVKERWNAYRFNKGLEAYESSDYTTAHAKFTSLAGDYFDREEHNIESQFYLGLMYDNGWGVPQDDAKAVRWYRRAADAEYADAQVNLGEMYEKGDGVLQDDILAYVWYYLAADKGHEKAIKNRDRMESHLSSAQMTEAQYNLGEMYEEGKGVSQDTTEAIKWYRLAAEAGLTIAQCNLGMLYAEKDDVLSYMWFFLATVQGHERAKTHCEGAANYMTIAQFIEAQAMAIKRMTPEQLVKAEKILRDYAKNP